MSKYETITGIMIGNLERFPLGFKWKTCIDWTVDDSDSVVVVRVVEDPSFPSRQLDAARPCEPMGPQGHEPEHRADFLV